MKGADVSEHTSFGLWLKLRRKALGLTQETLADRVGCSWETIRKIEDGMRKPSQQIAELLAEHLHVPADERADFVRFARSMTDSDASLPAAIRAARGVGRHPNNLPSQRTAFIGRTSEVERLCALLLRPDVHLLTLTGPPGIGKTRLSLQLAAQLLSDFQHGVFFVSLSSVTDPALVAYTVAQALNIKEVPTQSLVESLKGYLLDKKLLLVFDNFEQVVEAGQLVADLLRACPELKVLVTSREVLRVYSEHEYVVPPLAFPPSDPVLAAEEVSEYEAVKLFMQQAKAVRPDFTLDNGTALVVSDICRRVDGLPLAIELAAARVKVLSPRALLARLDHRLQVLTGGPQDLPPRQQTLRNAIAWSYEALNDVEKALFRRLAVFVGGCTLDAAEEVCSVGLLGYFLDNMTSLVDKCLLKHQEGADGEWRFSMLETIREYALEMLILAESSEEGVIRERHAAYFVSLAEAAEPNITSANRAPWLARLDAELDNLRGVLTWCQTGDAGPETGLRLGGALHWFWYFRGYVSEGRQWLRAVLESDREGAHTQARAKALYASGSLAHYHGNYASARSLLEESVAIWREVGDSRGLAYALEALGLVSAVQSEQEGTSLVEESLSVFRRLGDRWALAYALNDLGDAEGWIGDSKRRATLYEESLAIYRELGDSWGIAQALDQMGRLALHRGDYATARSRLEEALEIERAVEDKWYIAHSLRSLGDVALLQNDQEHSTALYEESLSLYRELGDKMRIAAILRSLGHSAQRQADYDRAVSLFRESLALYMELERYMGVTLSVAGLAGVLAIHGQAARAATLFGVTEVLCKLNREVTPTLGLVEYDRNRALVRAQLDEATFGAAWNRGRQLTREQALELVQELVYSPLSLNPIAESSQTIHSSHPAGLSDREVEVLRLVALGLTNAEIADKLSVSPRTVGAHLYSVYSKIGVNSRTAAARFATESGLA